MSEQRSLKIEGYIAPLLSKPGDPFKYSIYPTALARYVDTNITFETEDWRLSARLIGDVGLDKPFKLDDMPKHTKVTIYLDVTSVQYKPAEFHRDPFGTRLDTGYLKLHGKLLADEPAKSTSLDDLMDELNKREIPILDHTHDGYA